MHPSCLTLPPTPPPPPPLVLLIFNLACISWTFEWVISLCWNFQVNPTLYISFICKSFIRIWDESCPSLWNFCPIDMEWPYMNIDEQKIVTFRFNENTSVQSQTFIGSDVTRVRTTVKFSISLTFLKKLHISPWLF